MGYAPTVFEREEKPGGMMAYGIPAYKLPRDVVEAEIDILRELGVEIRCGVDVGKDVTLDSLRDEGFKAFYLAIGAQGSRPLGVEGEDAQGVSGALSFLRETIEADVVGNACEVADEVVVVGGGNVAVDAACMARRSGAKNVTMVSIEQREEMPASPDEIEEALADGVNLDCGWGPAKINVDANGQVESITLRRCTRVFDSEGRFAPEYDDADTQTIDCKQVVLAIGQSIEWGSLLEGSAVELGRGNTAVADGFTYQTAQDDVFVGGDAFTGPRFVIDAIAAGHEAATSLHRFVQKGSSLTTGRNQLHYVELDKSNIALNPGKYGIMRSPGARLYLYEWRDAHHSR